MQVRQFLEKNEVISPQGELLVHVLEKKMLNFDIDVNLFN